MLRIGVIMYQTSLTKGQELVAQRMVKEFRRQGHEAFLITSVYHDWRPVVDPEEVKRNGGFVSGFEEDLGIHVVRVNSEIGTWPPRRISFVNFMSVLPGLVDRLRLNALITHSTLWNGPEDAAMFVEWRRKLAEGGSLDGPMALCHMSHLQEPDEERYAIRERTYREVWNKVVMPHVISASDFILVTTPREARSLRTLGTSKEKIFLFPGGVERDADASSVGEGEQSRTRRIPGHLKIVASLGTIEERKNARAVLRVAERLADREDIHFVIAGRIETEYGERVKEEARGLPNVSVLEELSEAEKWDLIRSSFVNISMSRSEALGISQLEFLNAGVPVVTSGVGGQSWIVHNNHNGLVVNGPDDVEGAARAIVRLADDPSLRGRFGENGRLFASEFVVSRLVEKLSAALGEKIERGSRQAPSLLEEESVIDAWAAKGQRVAATSARLVVRSAETGRGAVTIPYGEIKRIVRHSKAPMHVLGLGAMVTLALLLTRVFYMGTLVTALYSSLGPVLGADVETLITAMEFVPLAVSCAFFILATKHGYQIEYGASQRLFLPRRFVRALRLADDLTPNSLFEDEKR